MINYQKLTLEVNMLLKTKYHIVCKLISNIGIFYIETNSIKFD